MNAVSTTRRVAGRRLAAVALACSPVMAAGCSDDGKGPTAPVATPAAACTTLATCNQCFLDGDGRCLSTDACASRVSTDVAACIATVGGCDPQALGACLRTSCGGTDGECQTG